MRWTAYTTHTRCAQKILQKAFKRRAHFGGKRINKGILKWIVKTGYKM